MLHTAGNRKIPNVSKKSFSGIKNLDHNKEINKAQKKGKCGGNRKMRFTGVQQLTRQRIKHFISS
jgi:hypothetical protein